MPTVSPEKPGWPQGDYISRYHSRLVSFFLPMQFALQSIEPIAKVNSAASSFSTISNSFTLKELQQWLLALSWGVDFHWLIKWACPMSSVDFLLAKAELHVQVSLLCINLCWLRVHCFLLANYSVSTLTSDHCFSYCCVSLHPVQNVQQWCE